MRNSTTITDQRAPTKPISFVLDRGGSLSTPVTLTIRPEDLTRNEPQRVSVHQTLGNGEAATGWVDYFGEGLGSVNINGHTGWGAGGRPDGATVFHELNDLVSHDYPAAKQAAVDSGMDPATVKLLFIDMLDDFAWSVVPTQFILRRSKSRPLLYQYNISLQAISNSVDDQFMSVPFFGSQASGLTALNGTIAKLRGYVASIKSMVNSAVSYSNALLSPISSTVHEFSVLSSDIFATTHDAINSITGGSRSVTNQLIMISTDLSRVGANVFKTISAIENLPSSVKADLMAVASAYNETHCIFKNSLRPQKFYEDYTGLYGASNCSSTTGGNPASIYAQRNSFDLMTQGSSPVGTNSSALSSINTIIRIDPVLAPMPLNELNRNLSNLNAGIRA